MKVVIVQAYATPGAKFPFSHLMQAFLAEQLSAAIEPSASFSQKFGPEFGLVVYVSAEFGTTKNRIVGPGVFRKMSSVEYTVFLPFGAISEAPNGRRAAVEFLLDGISSVLKGAELDATSFASKAAMILDRLCSDDTMLKKPWPQQ